ncbi:MAG: polysaccharide biosynthesis/export family protein [Myxococcota bacterium]
MRAAAVSSLVVAALLSLGACVGPKTTGTQLRPDQLAAPDAGVNANTLAANDLLEVRVYQEVDLSGVYRVSPDGHLNFPLCGKVMVGGMTAGEAADAITACLKKDFLRRPQVSVLVKEFNSKKVFVFGEVQKPGAYSFEEGMTIIHAVSQAGGFTKTASKNAVNVTRVVEGQEVKVPVKVEDIVIGRDKNFPLQPGDIIFVPESFL